MPRVGVSGQTTPQQHNVTAEMRKY